MRNRSTGSVRCLGWVCFGLSVLVGCKDDPKNTSGGSDAAPDAPGVSGDAAAAEEVEPSSVTTGSEAPNSADALESTDNAVSDSTDQQIDVVLVVDGGSAADASSDTTSGQPPPGASDSGPELAVEDASLVVEDASTTPDPVPLDASLEAGPDACLTRGRWQSTSLPATRWAKRVARKTAVARASVAPETTAVVWPMCAIRWLCEQTGGPYITRAASKAPSVRARPFRV